MSGNPFAPARVGGGRGASRFRRMGNSRQGVLEGLSNRSSGGANVGGAVPLPLPLPLPEPEPQSLPLPPSLGGVLPRRPGPQSSPPSTPTRKGSGPQGTPERAGDGRGGGTHGTPPSSPTRKLDGRPGLAKLAAAPAVVGGLAPPPALPAQPKEAGALPIRGPWDVKASETASAARSAGQAAAEAERIQAARAAETMRLPPPSPPTDAATAPATAAYETYDDLPIVEAVAEFLFDLFDANCLDEYQVLAAFEERACQAFNTPPEQGFTFEQEALHREFCKLFEGFTASFLARRGFTTETFFAEINASESVAAAVAGEGESEQEPVNELVSVLGDVANFQKWANSMRKQFSETQST